MRIGVDVRTLEGGAQHRGIGRFATSLIEALAKIDHENEYVFFTSHPHAKAPTFRLPRAFRQQHTHGKHAGLRGVKYIRIIYVMPRPLAVDRYKLDVFFHIDPSQPIRVRRTPVVSVLYDLIPYIYKDLYQHVHLGGYTPGHLIGYSRMRLKWVLLERTLQNYSRAAKIISISEHSKQDLLRMVPTTNAKNIITVPLAGELPVSHTKPVDSFARLFPKQFLFYIGGADPRKGLVPFTKSMETLWKKFPDVSLVLAGKEIIDVDVPEAVKLAKTAAATSKPKQIIRMGFISDDELAWAYQHAAAFVFPSRYEGFGLPVLQAMQAGCPVVAYNNSSVPEVAGNAAVLVKDGASMVPALEKILGNPTYRQHLITKGKKQAAKFTWEKTAASVLKVLVEAAEERHA